MNQIGKVNFAWFKMLIRETIYISHYIYIYTRKNILIQLYKNAKSEAADLRRK